MHNDILLVLMPMSPRVFSLAYARACAYASENQPFNELITNRVVQKAMYQLQVNERNANSCNNFERWNTSRA